MALELAKLEKINTMEPAAKNGFDHRAKSNNKPNLVPPKS
jgi:hypothetical protein